MRRGRTRCTALLGIMFLVLEFSVHAQQIPLGALVTPSTMIAKNGQPVTFALHGFIEFKSLAEMFPYIDSQTHARGLAHCS